MAGARSCGLVNNLGQTIDGIVGRRRRSLHTPQCAVRKEFPRGRHQTWQRAIRVTRKKPFRIDDRAIAAHVVFANYSIERIRSADSDSAMQAKIAARGGRY